MFVRHVHVWSFLQQISVVVVSARINIMTFAGYFMHTESNFSAFFFIYLLWGGGVVVFTCLQFFMIVNIVCMAYDWLLIFTGSFITVGSHTVSVRQS